MFIIKAKCAICEELHDARNKNCRIRQQKMKKTRSTKIDEISFFFVKQTQTSIRLVVTLCSSFLETHFSLNSVEREEFLALQNVSQNNSQNDSQIRISSLKSTSSKSTSSSTSKLAMCFFAVIFVIVVAFAVAFVLIQYFMISLMISSTQLNQQTIITQMREQSRQITILFNAISQLVSSITKFKRKMIVMFSNEDFTFTNSQRASSKRVVKSTKRAQITRIETARVKRTKIHEKSIELLISLNFETTRLEQKDALFVNKHVSFQSNSIDSFINAHSFANFSISNQSSSESLVVVAFDLNLTFAINFNTFDTSLSSSFIDFVSSFFIENFFSQITTIILQIFFERARREIRQQVKNVYSYDSIFNQIIKSFFSDAFSTKMSNHLLLYLFTTVNIQISTSAIKKIKRERDIDRSRDRSRENDVEI